MTSHDDREPGAAGREARPGRPARRRTSSRRPIAEAGDPFAAVRVIDLVARIERGRPIRIDDIVDRLNATYLDWLFTRAVVVDALVALQANWMADYRNASGIVARGRAVRPDGHDRGLQPRRPVDRRARPSAPPPACRAALDEFARRDRVARAERCAADVLRRRPAGRCACPRRARSR